MTLVLTSPMISGNCPVISPEGYSVEGDERYAYESWTSVPCAVLGRYRQHVDAYYGFIV